MAKLDIILRLKILISTQYNQSEVYVSSELEEIYGLFVEVNSKHENNKNTTSFTSKVHFNLFLCLNIQADINSYELPI